MGYGCFSIPVPFPFVLPYLISPHWQYLLIWLAIASFVDLLLVGIDKDRALHGEWRIREKTMLTVALLDEWPGLTLACFAFGYIIRPSKGATNPGHGEISKR